MTELIGQASPEQIERWKKAHKSVFAIKVDGHVCYVKNPDRKTLSFASNVGTKDPLKFNEIILENTFLGGSEAIKTDDELFLSASGKLAEIIELKEAEIEKL
jgi:hypothetical protein